MNSVLGVWEKYREKVLARIEEKEDWYKNLQKMYTKYGDLTSGDIDRMSSDDLYELWFSNNHISHISYFLEKKKTPESLYRDVTKILLDSNKSIGQALEESINIFKTDTRFEGKAVSGQVAQIIRTLFTVRNIEFSVVDINRLNYLLKLFDKETIDTGKLSQTFTEGINILSSINDEIASSESITGYNKRKILWNLWETASDSKGSVSVVAEYGDDYTDSITTWNLNTILYGPPGTGKTYYTINKAVSIIEGIDSEEKLYKKYQTRKELKKRFDELLISDWENPKGQIGFITFHQSMCYEDFIEGIKPLKPGEDDNTVFYDIKDGIFKLISNLSKKDKSNFNTMIDNLKRECSELESKQPIKIKSEYSTFTITYREGRTFRVKPEQSAYPDRDYPASIDNIRKVYENPNSVDVYNITYVRGILKHLYEKGLVPFSEADTEIKKPYVLIVDEINRGNVSQIFGELITLIEDDKRAGKSEALEVTLPYSKEKFSVPPNLYIIGTMNTADRSVEALDTALRRRFSFEFMPPRYDLPELDVEVSGLKISQLLKTINERITYLLDEDHQIGHSYFMNIEDEEGLHHVFRNKIIPLLKEYFYNDYGKIRLILGDQFVKLLPDKARPVFAVSDIDLPEKEQYRIMIDYPEFDIIQALKQTMANK